MINCRFWCFNPPINTERNKCSMLLSHSWCEIATSGSSHAVFLLYQLLTAFTEEVGLCVSFTPLYQYWTFHFSQRKLTAVKYSIQIHTLQRATGWPMNPFRVLSQGAGLSQELSTTSNVNLFPPFCKPWVYTGLAPGSCLSWRWLVVKHTHTHGRYVEMIPVFDPWRSLESSSVYLPTSIRGPGLSPGARGGDPDWSPRCVMVLGENVLRLRSGLDQVAAPQGICCLWTELLDYWCGQMSSKTGSDDIFLILSTANKGKMTKEKTKHVSVYSNQ